MEILKHGKLVRAIKCSNCECEFLYSIKDLCFDEKCWCRVIKCPECETSIKVEDLYKD